MNILVLTNLFPNPIQPHLAPWNRAQLCALSKRHEIRVICPVLWTEEWAACRAKRIPASRRSSCDGIAVEHPRYYYPPKVLRASYGDFFRWSVARSFRRAVRGSRPDIVYSSWAYPDGWAAVELASREGLPVVVKVHGSDVLSLERYPGRLSKTIEALRRADKIIAVSRDLAEKVIDLGVSQGRVRVVYNGLDKARFHPGPRDEARRRLGLPIGQPVILFVGNLVPVKQVNVLIEACAQLAARGLDFCCHVLGDGPLRPRLAVEASELGVTGRVTFHGQRPQEELADWYRAADVVALASRSEGIPNVLLEAAACGTPFVASRVGGIPEIEAFGRARLVPAGDPAAFADALAQMLDPEVTLSQSAPVPQTAPAQVPSWEESAWNLESVLEEAVVSFKSRTDRPSRSI